MDNHPRALTHVGLTVPDIEEAMQWYEDLFDFEIIAEPRTVRRGDDVGWEQGVDLFGHEFERVKIGHMTTGNQVGLEFFEFAGTGTETETEPREAGFFHVCVIDPDIETLASRIEEAGGEHYSDIWTVIPDEVYMTYCTDPWGNRIEIYTQSYERFQVAAANM